MSRSSTSAHLKRRRAKLFRRDPLCKRCGVLMVLPEDLEYTLHQDGIRRRKSFPDNMCTIEHIHEKLSEHRKQGKKGQTTILCNKCNHEIDSIKTAKIPIEELRRLSGN